MPLGLKLTYTFHRAEDGRCAAAKVGECEEKRAGVRAREKDREGETRRDFVADTRDAIDDASAQETLTMTQILGRRRGHTEVRPYALSALACTRSRADAKGSEVQKVRAGVTGPPESRSSRSLFPSSPRYARGSSPGDSSTRVEKWSE